MSDHPVKLLSSADGEPVALHDFGGAGPPLLLGHGNGLNAGMWWGALPSLTERFRCFGVDLRGHGACRPESEDYAVGRDRFAEDVLACIDVIGAPVRYAGHSLGGASALFAALVRPEALGPMWLFEPVLVPVGFDRGGDGPSMLVEISRKRRMEFDSVDDAFERFMAKPPFAGCDARSVRGYVEIGTYPIEGGVRLSCRGEDEARVYESGAEIDFDRLTAIPHAVVVASGGSTTAANSLPPRVAPLVAQSLPAGRWEEHPYLSHFGPMEAPASIAASIVAHLA